MDSKGMNHWSKPNGYVMDSKDKNKPDIYVGVH